MAVVPLKQTITVRRSGGVDEWGRPLPTQTFTLKCRIDEGSQLTVQHSEGIVQSGTVVAEAKILIDKLADIRYTDEISFTDELGITVTRNPKQIDVKRGLNGKPMLTVVYI